MGWGGRYTACGKCLGRDNYNWNLDDPEWCQCKKCVCGGIVSGKYKIKGNVMGEKPDMVEQYGMMELSSANEEYRMKSSNGTKSLGGTRTPGELSMGEVSVTYMRVEQSHLVEPGPVESMEC